MLVYSKLSQALYQFFILNVFPLSSSVMSAPEYPSEVTVKRGTDGKWSCPIENCTYSNGSFISVMKTHFRSHFKHLNWVNCKHCVASTPWPSSFKRHLARLHKVQEAEEGIDYEENKEFLQKEAQLIESASKISYEADEIDLPFKCDQCSKQFLWDSHLEVHKMREHHQEKKFECVSCSHATATRNEMYRHVVRAHFFKDDQKSYHSSANYSHHKSSENHGSEQQSRSSKKKNSSSATVGIDSGEKECKKRKIKSKAVDKTQTLPN